MPTLAPPPSPDSATSLARIIHTTLSYDTNLMLAAIISLLLVILFVLLLHLYTRWFLLQARRRSHSSVTVPHVIGSRLHHRFTIIDTSNSDNIHSNSKLGLPFSIIASLPLFVYDDDRDYGLECAICLSLFENEEIGRKLPDCGHAFHVECIDMWLHSHSTCPICRASIQFNNDHSRKADQLRIEIIDDDDDELNLNESTNYNEDVQITEIHETTNVDVENNVSSIGESIRKLLSNDTSSCSNRSGGDIHPSINVSDGESEA